METLQHPLICFMGASASGKTSISEALLGKKRKVITTTTRLKRPQEKNGEDYYFISREKFLALKAQEEFFEDDCYVGQYYGTQKIEVRRKTQQQAGFAVITVPGYYHLAEHLQPLLPIYLKIDEKTLVARLKKRRLSPAETAKRIAQFQQEMAELSQLQAQVPQLIVVDNTQSPEQTIYQLREKLAFYL